MSKAGRPWQKAGRPCMAERWPAIEEGRLADSRDLSPARSSHVTTSCGFTECLRPSIGMPPPSKASVIDMC